jgi:hypothetical protein
MTATNTPTHLFYDGKGGWIQATKRGGRWQFSNASDLIRWLSA